MRDVKRIRGSSAKSALFAAAIVLGAASTARAQELSRSERDELARVHFRAGSRYFDLRRYAEAAGEFERVFELSGQNALLYNAGRAWQAAGRAREAVRDYERFLTGDLSGIPRASVEATLAPLRERAREEERLAAQRSASGCPEPAPIAAESAASSTGSGATVAAPTNSSNQSNASAPALLQLQTRVTYQHRTLDAVAPWVLLGVGGVFGGLAAWQGIAYASDAAAVTSATAWGQPLTVAQANAREESRNAILSGAAAGLFVLGGGLWLALRGPGERREEVIRSAWVAPTHNGLAAGGRF